MSLLGLQNYKNYRKWKTNELADIVCFQTYGFWCRKNAFLLESYVDKTYSGLVFYCSFDCFCSNNLTNYQPRPNFIISIFVQNNNSQLKNGSNFSIFWTWKHALVYFFFFWFFCPQSFWLETHRATKQKTQSTHRKRHGSLPVCVFQWSYAQPFYGYQSRWLRV